MAEPVAGRKEVAGLTETFGKIHSHSAPAKVSENTGSGLSGHPHSSWGGIIQIWVMGKPFSKIMVLTDKNFFVCVLFLLFVSKTRYHCVALARLELL